MRKEKVLSASNTLLAILLVVALVGMVNWLGYRQYLRGDWTSSKLYSLSEKTRNIVKDIKTEVRVVVLMTPSTSMFAEIKELLSRYQAANSQIKVEYIDPDRDPLRTEQLAQEFRVSAANTVVFAAGERKKYVTSDQLAEYDYSGYQTGQPPKLKGFKGEEQFTAAILGVVSPKVPKIYFTEGHGEADPDNGDRGGLTALKELLKRDNMEIFKASIFAGAIPAECDLLVIAGPRGGFTEQEKTALRTYLNNGGRALIMLGAVLAGQQPSGLEELVKDYGVAVNNDIVLDPKLGVMFFQMGMVPVQEYRSHPVVDGMKGMAVIFPAARSVTTVTAPGATSTILMTTSDQGYGETDLVSLLTKGQTNKDDKDTAGPVSLAVAAEKDGDKEKGWRLVVIGNAAFVANGQIPNSGNATFALNAINWLVKQERALGIPPRNPEQVQLFLNANQMRNVLLICLGLLPGVAIGLGIFVWWRRRH